MQAFSFRDGVVLRGDHGRGLCHQCCKPTLKVHVFCFWPCVLSHMEDRLPTSFPTGILHFSSRGSGCDSDTVQNSALTS